MRILITGGTGSLGRALLKRFSSRPDTNIVIFSRDEAKQSQVRSQYPQHTYILGDVAKIRDLERAMHGVDIVFHFAAYKQVPSAQNNVAATIETNVIGSQNVVDAAISAGVKKVVASSTDKACAPVNAYGASKSLMESIFQNGNRYDGTTFHLARYGNVISSTGSVIPLFRRQASQGGPLTVTDERMTRFWITLDRAVELVLRALKQPPGVIVVPKAPAMSVWNLAAALGPECPITVTGIRPGEKIHEAMVSESESFHTTEDYDHYYIYPPTSGKEFTKTPFSYTSEEPVKVLSDSEILSLIKETEEKYGF